MSRVLRISCACAVLFLSFGVGQSRAAADSAVDGMLKAMPGDAILFVAAGGDDALKGDFEKTIAGRIWNDPGVQSFYQSIKTQVWAKMQQQVGDPNEVKKIDMALGLMQLAGSRPIVCGVAPLKGPAQDKQAPPIYVFAVLDAGARKAEFEAALNKVESLAGPNEIADVNVGSMKMRGPKGKTPVPLYWGWSGGYLVAAINDANGAAMQYLQKPRATLAESITKTPGVGNALVIRANLQRAVSVVDTFLRQSQAGEPADVIATVLKESGLSDVKTLTMRAGFDGSEVVSGSFVEAPAPRTGLLAVLKPVDPALLDMVDARAVTACVTNIDLAGVYDTVMRTVKAAAGEHSADVEKGIAAFEAQTKVSIRKGLLESLGGPVIVYSVGIGAVPESPMGGLAVFVKLKDAALFEKTMTDLGSFVAAQSNGKLQVSSETREDGTTVHTLVIPQLAMMGMTPAWSIAKDYAVIGSNAAMHDAAVKQMAATGEDRKSIRDTAGYKEIASRLPENPVSLRYVDSRTRYTQAMAMLQQFWPMAAMFATQAGLQLPPTLPQLGPIINDMKPSYEVTWIAPDGLYSQYRGDGIEASLSSVAGAAVGLGVALPALAHARERAKEVASMSNLKQIGLAVIMYADDHDGNFPADLQGLGKYLGNSSERVLQSPRKPKGFTGPSYIYIPGQTMKVSAQNILAYENPAFAGDKINAVFMDGHVEAMKPDQFREALEATYKALGKPMPEIKLQGEKAD
jgi:prepilin-type processing-associated H-X9-DG protein